jgi:KaiC/GvpD/RAD55 family RecA-like ATPase
MTDNIVFLEVRSQAGLVGRTLRVAKARGVAHDLQPHEMRIDSKGLSVLKASG